MSSSSTPPVVAVVLNWNAWQDTISCVGSLLTSDYPSLRLIVVDNGSSDCSVAEIRERCPDITVLETGANLGYGGGNNVGMRWALREGAEYVWILNSDTVVPPGCLPAMLGVMARHPELGILGTEAYHPVTGAPESGGVLPMFVVPPPGAPSDGSRPAATLSEEARPLSEDLVLADYVHGSNVLLRREVVDALGGFDLRYFHFWEDLDLCWRAWQAGWLVGRTQACTIGHRSGTSTAGASGMVMYYSLRNLLLFSAVSAGTSVPRIMTRPRILLLWLRCLVGIRGFFRPGVKVAVVRALIDAARGRGGRNRKYSPA